MSARLVTVREGQVDLTFVLPESGATIGRTPDNLIQLTDPEVSKKHARIDLNNGAWVVEDRGSKNGTFVEGEKIEKSVLSNGAHLRMGSMDLVFSDDAGGDDVVPAHLIDFGEDVNAQTLQRKAYQIE